MIVQAIVDRVENGNTYFTIEDFNAEISISDKSKEGFTIGDTVKLTILNDGKVTVFKQ